MNWFRFVERYPPQGAPVLVSMELTGPESGIHYVVGISDGNDMVFAGDPERSMPLSFLTEKHDLWAEIIPPEV